MQEKKNPGEEGETLNQESRGRGTKEGGTKRNATLLECHAMLTKLGVQQKQNVGTWLAHMI